MLIFLLQPLRDHDITDVLVLSPISKRFVIAQVVGELVVFFSKPQMTYYVVFRLEFYGERLVWPRDFGLFMTRFYTFQDSGCIAYRVDNSRCVYICRNGFW